MSTKTIYTVYKTTNNINGKIYIGVHKQLESEELNYYLGSGLYFIRALEKYGKDNFVKEIIFEFDNEEDMHDMEAYIVDQEFVDRNDTYNLQTGGGNRGILSEESKRKISDTLKERYASGRIKHNAARKGSTPWNKGLIKEDDLRVGRTKESCEKSSIGLIKYYQENEHHSLGAEPWNKGLKTGHNSDESNERRSKTLKLRYKNQDGNRKGCAPWNKGKPNPYAKTEQLNSPRFECEHCGKVTNKGNYKRWHSDNCKNKY